MSESTTPTPTKRRTVAIAVASAVALVAAVAVPLTVFAVSNGTAPDTRSYAVSTLTEVKAAAALNEGLDGFTAELASALDADLAADLETARDELASALEDGTPAEVASARENVEAALTALAKNVASTATSSVKTAATGSAADAVSKAVDKLNAAIADDGDIVAAVRKVVELSSKLTGEPVIAAPLAPDGGTGSGSDGGSGGGNGTGGNTGGGSGTGGGSAAPPAPPVEAPPAPPVVVVTPPAPIDQNRYVQTNGAYVDPAQCYYWAPYYSHDPGPGGTSISSIEQPWTYENMGTYIQFYLC